MVSCMSTLCRALAAQGVDVTVYTTNASGADRPLDVPINQPVELGGVNVWYFKSTFGPKSGFYSIGLIKKLKKTVGSFDVIYISAIWQWLGIETAKVCRDAKAAMIIGTHGSFSKSLMGKSALKKRLYLSLFLKKAIQGASAIHITTFSERNDAAGFFDGMLTFVVPNAVDPQKFHPLPGGRERFRNRHGIPANVPVLVTIGRPDWMKRNDLLIKAIARYRNWRLVVVGADTEGMALQWKALASALGVHDRVVWTGPLYGDELLEALTAADFFALVSENENFGMVVVEALMCGLPVMLSKDVGVWESIKDEKFVMTVEKTEGSVAQCLGDFERWSMSAARPDYSAREAAIKSFSPRVVAGRFIKEISAFAKRGNEPLNSSEI
ncbi:MAG: glycosyltransferase [Thermodesulfovibrionales bacterium]